MARSPPREPAMGILAAANLIHHENLMLASTENITNVASEWLADFQRALAARDKPALEGLFKAESHWRDVLALTWRIATVSGAQALAAKLSAHAGRAEAKAFEI